MSKNKLVIKPKVKSDSHSTPTGPYFLEVWTDKPQSIRGLLEALKDLLDECNINFDENGMRIKAMDGSQVALVHVRLDADNFNKYYTERDFSIGINISGLHKLLKTVDTSDVLKMFVHKDDKYKLCIQVENSVKNSVLKFSYNILDIDDGDISIPEVSFDNIITMPSVELHNYCRLMNNIGKTVEFKSVGDELFISCNGDSTTMDAQLRSNGNDVDICAENENEIVQGKFLLKFLLLFTKAYNLSGTVELLLKNDYPMILKYEIAGLGEIKYCLAPIHNQAS